MTRLVNPRAATSLEFLVRRLLQGCSAAAFTHGGLLQGHLSALLQFRSALTRPVRQATQDLPPVQYAAQLIKIPLKLSRLVLAFVYEFSHPAVLAHLGLELGNGRVYWVRLVDAVLVVVNSGAVDVEGLAAILFRPFWRDLV